MPATTHSGSRPGVSSRGRPLDTAAGAVGELRRSRPDAGAARLREQLVRDGYLFLPASLDRRAVLGARRALLARLADRGWLASGSAVDDGIAAAEPGERVEMNRLALECPPLLRLLYGPRMLGLFEELFGGPVRHFDYTWLRTVRPGGGTAPHMDSVFMNRGTPRLLTAWTPLGDIDRVLGGLAVLEGSHRLERVVRDYASRDVDTYCANSDDPDERAKATREALAWDGKLAPDGVTLRERFDPAERDRLGLRWLTADYRAGDVLVFTMVTAHLGLDNNSPDRLRLSSDSRYQPASEPADPRWVGPDPSAHGSRSKVGVIC